MMTLYVVAQDNNAHAIAEALGKPIVPEIDKRLAALTAKVARHIKGRAPIRSGKLRASISERRIGVLEHAVQETGVSYGPYQRFGTKAHYIFPINKKALMSGPLTAKGLLHHPLNYVGPPMTRLHPGPKATHYVEYGLLDSRSKIDYFIARLPDTIFLGMKGRGLGGFSTGAQGFNQWG